MSSDRGLLDITPRITNRIGVWPGDTPPTREVLLEIERGGTVTLSTLRSTVHLGAHADGPNHYGAGAAAIDERALELYLGPCALVAADVRRGERVTPDVIESRLLSVTRGQVPARVLIATGTFPDPEAWNNDFAALSPELVDWLQARGVRLVGIDTPSVDLFDDKLLLAHKRFLAHDMAILEGLVLKDVDPGIYELIALPLPLAGFDASPVRAVLRTLQA
jgi:arylformamidase